MTSPPNDTGNAITDQIADFMLIEFTYKWKLLLPIEMGRQFVEIYSHAQSWEEEYSSGKKVKISPTPPEITISYITREQLAKAEFDAALGLDS